ncbi:MULTISPECIES: hypothetical protein [unclassified Bacillus cereus group]|uniref:hypothetical protein n=1 Tax=unclassified Bacillus cereus group TaxID=2750818 RepID=UPI001F567ED1|nr:MULTISPECIES: hypothetical protein [unclassified Bacillus cereus group]
MNKTLIELTNIVEDKLGITLTEEQRWQLTYYFEEPVTNLVMDAHLNGMKKGKEEGRRETMAEVLRDLAESVGN